MKNNFYAVLPSNSCPLIHPKNEASNFIVDFENPMYLDGEWEVALMDFTFIYKLFPIYSNVSINYTTGISKTKEIVIYINNKEKKLICDSSIALIDGDHTLLIALAQNDNVLMFETLEDAKRFGFNKSSFEIQLDNRLQFQDFKDNKTIEKMKIKLIYSLENSASVYFNENLYINTFEELNDYIVNNFSYIFKTHSFNKNEPFQFSLENSVKSVTFDRIMVETLGLDRDTFTQPNMNIPHEPEIFKGIEKPKLLTNPHQMFIYSNIVEPIIVGDTFVPLLKSVWLDSYINDQVVQIIIKNPMYLPVSTSCINNIEINIRDDQGYLIDFAQDSKTHLTLHFRKINV